MSVTLTELSWKLKRLQTVGGQRNSIFFKAWVHLIGSSAAAFRQQRIFTRVLKISTFAGLSNYFWPSENSFAQQSPHHSFNASVRSSESSFFAAENPVPSEEEKRTFLRNMEEAVSHTRSWMRNLFFSPSRIGLIKIKHVDLEWKRNCWDEINRQASGSSDVMIHHGNRLTKMPPSIFITAGEGVRHFSFFYFFFIAFDWAEGWWR